MHGDRDSPMFPQHASSLSMSSFSFSPLSLSCSSLHSHWTLSPARRARVTPTLRVFFFISLCGMARPMAPWVGWRRREYFRTDASSTFQRIETGKTMVNLTFLDGTRMEGFDGQDMVQLGQVQIDTSITMSFNIVLILCSSS